jgi:hypothetical protein
VILLRRRFCVGGAGEQRNFFAPTCVGTRVGSYIVSSIITATSASPTSHPLRSVHGEFTQMNMRMTLIVEPRTSATILLKEPKRM